MPHAEPHDAAPATVAAAIAEYLSDQGIERVFSLPGSHMKPIWAELAERGVRVVTARHEVAAVHMAQAEADLRHGLAVAIVTTGPGLTNAVTGIGCAFLPGRRCSSSRPGRPTSRPAWARWRRSTRRRSSGRSAGRWRWSGRAGTSSTGSTAP